jgi:pimeloyl-ACP methyl ester carboxylesterase
MTEMLSGRAGVVPEEIELDVGGVTLAAKRWRNGPLPVLALHGWLDNAASFDVLAPKLRNADVVALDLAGHGHSYHRTLQAAYNIWDDLPDILRAADRLGWSQFHLLGHSRGAIIAALLTATLPERVISTALLDGYRPEPVPSADFFRQLALHLRQHVGRENRSAARYETKSRALIVRARVSGMREDSARLIVERGLQQVDGGWLWRADPRLSLASAVKLSAEQVMHMETLVAERPCRLWLARDGSAGWLSEQRPLESIILPWRLLDGSHHFHMEEQADLLAEDIQEFWEAAPFRATEG